MDSGEQISKKGKRIKEKGKSMVELWIGFALTVIARSIGLMGGDEAISTFVILSEATRRGA